MKIASVAPVRVTALAILSLAALFLCGDAALPKQGTPAAAGSGGTAKGAPANDALSSLNDASRAAYRRARDMARARCGPVVLVEGDDLVLAYGLYRTSVHITPDTYVTLKAISHIPLAVHSFLDVQGEDALDDKLVYDLKQYRDLVANAASGLGNRALGIEQMKCAKAIADVSLEFLAGIIETRRVPGKLLDDYRRRMRPLLEANAADAARVQIAALHQQMQAWKGRLTDAEWEKLRVIVMGTQLPRKGNLAVQYFLRLLGEPEEGGRVVYAEAIFDESRALDLLATRLVDTRIGTAFFADPTRMHRDLLSDAARDYLDQVFPKGKP